MNLEFFKNNNGNWFLITNNNHFIYFYSLHKMRGEYTSLGEENRISILEGELTKILEYI